MLSRIYMLILLFFCVSALDTSPQGQADVAEVLTKCLGRDTLLRWQRQLVAASRFCGGEALLVEEDPVQVSDPSVPALASPAPAIISSTPANLSPDPADTLAPAGNVPAPAGTLAPASTGTAPAPALIPSAPIDTPANSPPAPQAQQQLQANQGGLSPLTIVPSNQPFIPSQAYPFYFQKITYPYFVSGSFPHKKYYFIKGPQSPTKHTVISSHLSNSAALAAQNTSPNTGFSFVQNGPGFSKPIVQYYPVRKPGDDLFYYQPMEAYGSRAAPVSVASSGAETGRQRVVTHDQTFTDPGLKFEQTEQYHREQQIIAALRQEAGTQPGASQGSLEPFRGGIGRPRNKRKREADALSVFQPPTSSTFRRWETSLEAEQFSRDRHLRLLRSRAAEKLGNMTCVMKAMKALTDNLEPNHEFITNSLLELPVSNDVYEEFKNSQEYCRKFSQCLPERKKTNGIEMSLNLSKAFEFFRCFGKEKVRVCLQADSLALADLLNRNSVPRDTVFYPHHSKLGQTLGEVDQLLNGAGSQFLDLVLL